MRLPPSRGRSCAVGAVVTRLTVIAVALVGWPLPGLIVQEISEVGREGTPVQVYVSSKAVVAPAPVPTMKPFVPLTVIGTCCVPPTPTVKVCAVVERLKVSVVAVTVRLTVVVVLVELVGVIVIVCGPDGAMLATVEIVNAVVALSTPSKVTLPGLKLQSAPVGRPLQLLGLKLMTVPVDPLTGAMVRTTDR